MMTMMPRCHPSPLRQQPKDLNSFGSGWRAWVLLQLVLVVYLLLFSLRVRQPTHPVQVQIDRMQQAAPKVHSRPPHPATTPAPARLPPRVTAAVHRALQPRPLPHPQVCLWLQCPRQAQGACQEVLPQQEQACRFRRV